MQTTLFLVLQLAGLGGVLAWASVLFRGTAGYKGRLAESKAPLRQLLAALVSLAGIGWLGIAVMGTRAPHEAGLATGAEWLLAYMLLLAAAAAVAKRSSIWTLGVLAFGVLMGLAGAALIGLGLLGYVPMVAFVFVHVFAGVSALLLLSLSLPHGWLECGASSK